MGIRTAGIIIIGDEILKGDVKDENTHFLCKRFHALGVRVASVSVVADSLGDIAHEVKRFSDKYDIVVTSGGIGPTHDDVTYEGIARAFNEELVVDQDLKRFWSRFYTHSDRLGEDNPAVKMSKIPKSARVVKADLIKSERVIKFPFVIISNIYVFPGIPTYLKTGFAALEKEHFTGGSTKFHNRVIYLNVHESSAIYALNQTAEEFAQTVKIGSYPITGNQYYLTRLTLESTDSAEVDKARSSLVSRLNPDWIEDDRVEFLENAETRLKELINKSQPDFSQRVSSAFQAVEKCYSEFKDEEIFLCFNGGKDCTALLHLVHCYLASRGPEGRDRTIQVLYIRGKEPFVEMESFINDTATRYNVDMTLVDGPIKTSLEKLTAGSKSQWKAVFMGTRSTDPHCSKLNTFQETDPGWPKLMRVSPFLDWRYEDVWNFLRSLRVPYCSLYDMGYTSLGSRHNTKPNPDLAYEENGVIKYRPAYSLANPHSERNGRC